MNNFCVLPFNSVSISATGELRPCCNAYNSGFDLNVSNISVGDFINNKKIKNLRKEFIEDKQSASCNRCWQMESIRNRSFRNTANDNENYGLRSPIPINKNTTVNFEDIQYIDITLGNKCNLACRMCNPYSSSLLAKQLSQIGVKHNLNDGLIDFNRETKDKILELISRAKNLNTVYMLGGEPLINEFHDEIIQLLIDESRASKITLQYSTNLQIDVEKYLEMWSKFKYVDLNISIDGSHQTYEYIRWPGRWEKVFENLKRVCEFRKDANFYPSIATTSQNLNASNIYDLVSECTTLNETYLPFYFIPVTGSNYLHITPKHILHAEITKLKTLPDPYGRIEELIRHYRSCAHAPINKDEVVDFFQKQEQFDKLRNQNLFDINPYFEELADQYKIQRW